MEATMDVDGIRRDLGIVAPWERRRDGLWIEAPGLDARAMARLLCDAQARWVTMTVSPAPGGFRLIYHWDTDGTLLSIVTAIGEPCADSLIDIVPAADWVEREMRDYYAIEFTGRTDTPALMLRPGDRPGLFSRTTDSVRDLDPADLTDRAERDADGAGSAGRAAPADDSVRASDDHAGGAQ
jgi:hypothetical protein